MKAGSIAAFCYVSGARWTSTSTSLGIFWRPRVSHRSLSCVGALVVREESWDALASRYASLLRSWGSGGKEVKGSNLHESQVAAVIDLLVETR